MQVIQFKYENGDPGWSSSVFLVSNWHVPSKLLTVLLSSYDTNMAKLHNKNYITLESRCFPVLGLGVLHLRTLSNRLRIKVTWIFKKNWKCKYEKIAGRWTDRQTEGWIEGRMDWLKTWFKGLDSSSWANGTFIIELVLPCLILSKHGQLGCLHEWPKEGRERGGGGGIV